MNKSKRNLIFINTACVLLSILSVLILVLTPFLYSIVGVAKTNTIVKIVQEVDYEKVINENPQLNKVLKESGVSGKDVNNLIKSKEAGKLIEVYSYRAKDILNSIPKEKRVNIKLLKNIVDKNFDFVIDNAEKTLNVKLPKKDIKKAYTRSFEKNKSEINKIIPYVEESRVIVEKITTSQIIKNTLNHKYIICSAIVLISCLVGIAVMKRKKSGSLLWITVNFVCASTFILLIVLLSKNLFVNNLAFKLSHFEMEIVESAVSVSTDKLIYICIAFIIIEVITFAFYITNVLNNKKIEKIKNSQNDVNIDNSPTEQQKS